ncbi:DUF4382 domain-containing protein [Halobellus sp. EA9]|uniref:DUF4382 domain-containing protein n=1 Tax=Halobellus sp. EA9 TaxID=3421647 RepID=UPI003EB80A09
MNRNAIATALVAALVLVAGCSAGTTGSGGDVATDGTATAMESTSSSGSGGTVNLYISDQRNDIEDFEHLNVTITRVGLLPAGEDDADESDDDADGSADGGDTETETEVDDDANETETEVTVTSAASTEEMDDGEDADDEGGSEWIEYEVDNRTVDLTRLKGANATQLSSFDVPNGTYEKVFVYVSGVEGTLKDGSDQRVKLPSGKLQLNSEFTVGAGEEVDFVFDITAIKAGQSGKYILKPVISESGTDVEIDRVDEDEDDDDHERGGQAADRPDGESRALDAGFVGNVTRGENATLSVTQNGSAVANASVSVNDEAIGTTDADGTITFSVPEDAEGLSVSVTKGEMEGEVEIEFASDSDSEAGSDQGQSNGQQTATA